MRLASSVVLLLLTLPLRAVAADMCAGPCSFSIEFPQGGSVTAAARATVLFGLEGGLLDLGDGGSMDLGDGGGFTTVDGGLPNMSQGGSIVLGPGGSISFGPGGVLATGAYGAVATDGALDIVSPGSVTLDAEGAVQMGTFRSDGEVHVTSGGNVTIGETPAVAVNITLPPNDASARIDVTTTGAFSMGNIESSGGSYAGGSVWITTTGGLILDGGTAPADGSGTAITGSSAGLCISMGGLSGDGCDSLDLLVLDNIGAQAIALNQLPLANTGERVSSALSTSGGGGLGVFTLLALGLAGLRRLRSS